MTLAEAVRVARIVLHGVDVKGQVTTSEISQAYNVLAAWHPMLNNIQTLIEKGHERWPLT